MFLRLVKFGSVVLAKEWKYKNLGLTEGRKNYMKSTIKLEHICSYKNANI